MHLVRLLAGPALEYQGGVGAAEAETVAHHGVDLGILDGAALDRQIGDFRVDFVDVDRAGNEVAFHHQHAIDRFLHAGGAQGVAGQALGRADGRRLGAEHFAHRAAFRDIADRSRGAVGVEVVDRRVDGGQGLLHAAHRTFATRRDHVVAVGGGAIADDFGVDLGAALERVLQFFDHHHAAATGDDETVTLGIVGPRGFFRGVVVLGGEGAHGIEQEALGPVLFFAAAGEHHVLLAQLDLLHGVADAMSAGGAGGGDRVVDALDLERRRQTGRYGAAHGARHTVGTDPLDALLAHDVQGFHLVEGRGATGTGDQADARIGNIFGAETGVLDRLFHGQGGEGCRIAHEAINLAVDQFFQFQVNGAGHLAAQAHLGVFRIETDTCPASAKVGGYGFFIIAQAGNDAQTGNHDATHGEDPLETVGRSEQADAQAFVAVDLAAIDTHAAVGDGQNQRAGDGAFDMNVIGNFLGRRQDLTKELHFAGTQGATATGVALPA